MEEKSRGRRRAHCLVLSYPFQGHINPMIQFSKLLVHEGVRVTVATTRFYCKSLNKDKLPPSISLESISDGSDNGGIAEAGTYEAYLNRFWQVGPKSLAELLEKLGRTEYPVDCLIYNSFLPWALDVASRFGISGAIYLTQNLPVNSIYYHVKLGKLQVPLSTDKNENEIISLPAMPKLQIGDMPSFFLTYEQDRTVLRMLVDQFSNMDKADWVLCNAFYDLDKEMVDWTTKIWPRFRTIGPNIPSMFLDKRVKDDEDYGAAQFESEEEEECMEWLDDKPKGSVVYVSFGSLVTLNEDQMGEIAFCLRDITNTNNCYFYLWVVRASEETKLPKDFAKKSEKGLVVRWCSQLKVLAHEAVGCFVTHCGWNSTLETLSLGVPTVAVPQWSDQTTNAKYIEHVWKVGIRAPLDVDEKKIVRGEALKHCIREVIESEKGKEMKKNAIQWKTLAKEAVSEGGSSHTNIVEFVNSFSLTT